MPSAVGLLARRQVHVKDVTLNILSELSPFGRSRGGGGTAGDTGA